MEKLCKKCIRKNYPSALSGNNNNDDDDDDGNNTDDNNSDRGSDSNGNCSNCVHFSVS